MMMMIIGHVVGTKQRENSLMDDNGVDDDGDDGDMIMTMMMLMW